MRSCVCLSAVCHYRVRGFALNAHGASNFIVFWRKHFLSSYTPGKRYAQRQHPSPQATVVFDLNRLRGGSAVALWSRSCAHLYIYIYVINVCVYICVHIQVYMYTCVYTCVYIYIHSRGVCIHGYVYGLCNLYIRTWTIIHTSGKPMHIEKDAEDEHGVHVGRLQHQQ